MTEQRPYTRRRDGSRRSQTRRSRYLSMPTGMHALSLPTNSVTPPSRVVNGARSEREWAVRSISRTAEVPNG
jgi:hypothetical protein